MNYVISMRPLGIGIAALLVFLSAGFAEQDIFFSEYVEGSEGSGVWNRALEIYNPTEETIDPSVTEIRIEIYEDGASTPSYTAIYGAASSLLIPPGEVFVAVPWTASPELLALADDTILGLASVDGNDALVLRRGGVVVDVIGQVGVDPGPGGWGAGAVTTTDCTLRRKPAVCAGDSVVDDPFDPAGEWDGYPIDTFDGLGSHESDCNPTGTEPSTWGAVKALFR